MTVLRQLSGKFSEPLVTLTLDGREAACYVVKVRADEPTRHETMREANRAFADAVRKFL